MRCRCATRTGVQSWLEGMERCTVYRGHARFLSPHEVQRGRRPARRRSASSSMSAAARWFLTCQGSIDVRTLTNTTMLELDALPQHLVVVGGSYVGLEFAQMYRRFGSAVTVVEKAKRLVSREDEDVSAAVKDILEAEGIAVRLEAECIRFEPRGAEIAVGVDCASGAPRKSSARTCCSRSGGGPTPTISISTRPASPSTRAATSSSMTQLRTSVGGHLGAGRLQRPGRLHPYLLQRFRNRGGEPARRRTAAGQRSDPRLRPLHRSAARPRRHDRRPRYARSGRAAARRPPPDDPRRPRRREGRDAGIHEGRRRRRDAADPRRGDPRNRRRRGHPRASWTRCPPIPYTALHARCTSIRPYPSSSRHCSAR